MPTPQYDRINEILKSWAASKLTNISDALGHKEKVDQALLLMPKAHATVLETYYCRQGTISEKSYSLRMNSDEFKQYAKHGRMFVEHHLAK